MSDIAFPHNAVLNDSHEDRILEVSSFTSDKDNVPKPVAKKWSELVPRLSKHVARKTKAGAAFSPAKYKAGAKRGNDGVVELNLAVLDIDGGLTLDRAKNLLEGRTFVLYTSFSHTPERHKFRVVMPFIRPCTPTAWSSTVFRGLQSLMGGACDEATKDPARIYYTASHPEGTNTHEVIVGEGAWLDPDSFSDSPAVAIEVEIKGDLASPHPVHAIEGIESGSATPHPADALQEVVSRCKFLSESSMPENQNALPEPLWMALISNYACFEGADGEVHKASEHHENYNQEETQKKLERLERKNAPVGCERIRALGYKGCPTDGCKKPDGTATKAPAGLVGHYHFRNDLVASPDQRDMGKMPDVEIVDEFIDEQFSGGVRYASEQFYVYRYGAFQAIEVKAEIRRLLATKLGRWATSKRIDGLVKLMEDRTATVNEHFRPDLNYLCLKNGTLNLTTTILEQHSARHKLRCRLDVVWDPSAKCPRFETFLNQVFANDADKKEKIQFLKEWMGYLLTPDSSQQKMLWLVGGGSNGKSVLLSVISHLVGRANISNAMIERLDRGPVRAELEGKLVNISGEIAADAMINDGYLKAIVGGGEIDAERKYKAPYSFAPYVRMMAATNNLPRTNDISHGFFRRTVILQFNRRFSSAEADPKLTDALLAEASGVLNWAIYGLRSLRVAGQFTLPPSSAAALEQYRVEANPVRIFAEQCLVPTTQRTGFTSTELFKVFQVWAKEFGFSPRTLVTFGKAFSDLSYARYKSGKDYWQVQPNPSETMRFLSVNPNWPAAANDSNGSGGTPIGGHFDI